MNPILALTGATCDRILLDSPVNRFILDIMAEAQAIGARIGCDIDERGEDRNEVTLRLGAFKTSMLNDVGGRAINRARSASRGAARNRLAAEAPHASP